MALGKGIPVINGFDLNSKLPLDSRTVADTMEEMNKLVTDGSVGDGQLCYCKADKKLYVLKEGAWSEAGGGGGGQIIDLNGQIDPNDNTKITQEGYDLIQQAYENNTLLGISFVMFDTIEAVCMFDYVSLDIETMTNTYCFKFEAGETIIFKIKSDLTMVQSAQSSIAVYSQFTDLWYEGDYVSAIMSNETIYKIPYTLIYSRKDEYQNERLQFKNDTYDKTIYNIPTLPSDASTKNYALNSVNGALTWNTIGNGLEIKDGVIKVKQETQVFNLNSENVIPFYNTDLSSMLGYKLKITNNTNAKTYGKTFIEKLLNKDKYNKIAKASISLLEPNTLNLYCEITNLYPIVTNGSAPSLYSIMYFNSLAIISIYCDADNNDFIIDFRLAHPDETTLAQIQQILNLIANGGVIRFNLLGE